MNIEEQIINFLLKESEIKKQISDLQKSLREIKKEIDKRLIQLQNEQKSPNF